jgi:hypothetical protein
MPERRFWALKPNVLHKETAMVMISVEILTATIIKTVGVWVVIMHSFVGGYRRFGETCCIYLPC